MESHLHPLSDGNVIFKYADDTNLLVPENTDCTLADEFSHIKRLADTNGLIINFDKTKELLLIAHTLLGITSHSLLQVLSRSLLLRLLGVIFQSSLSFAAHVDYVLKVCSQRIFLLKQLRCEQRQSRKLHDSTREFKHSAIIKHEK